VTHLRQIMLEELERRNYAPGTIRCYIRTVEHFARHFHRSPDQLGPDHIRRYQATMFREWKLAPNRVTQKLAALRRRSGGRRLEPPRFPPPACAQRANTPGSFLNHLALTCLEIFRSVRRTAGLCSNGHVGNRRYRACR
jgi:hypothetical protein